MTRRSAARTAAVLGVLALASCFGESTGPGELRPGHLSIAPRIDPMALQVVSVDRVVIRFTIPGTTTIYYDTIVDFPANLDTLVIDVKVPVAGISQQFDLTMLMIDDPAHDTVFVAGPVLVTATAGGQPSTPATPPFYYVGTGATAAGVRFVTAPGQVFFGDTAVFVAEAFDSNNVTIPNTPLVWSSSDTVKAKVPDPAQGRVVGGIARGGVNVGAALLPTAARPNPTPVLRPLTVQPKANAFSVTGSGQTGSVGAQLPTPVGVHVIAADNLGVQGVVVTFTVTSGGGVLSQVQDTTDANGDASTLWTLGTTPGAQGVSVAVAGVTGSTGVGATGIVGTAKKLVFTVQPTAVAPLAPITPAIQVAAQDTFGNLVTGFTGAVTLALGANPGAATLFGTLTVNAVAGVATFTGVSLDNISSGYTLTASGGGLTGATSNAFGVSAPANGNAWINAAGGNWSTAANWSKGTVPNATDTIYIRQSGTYTVNLDVSATVATLIVGAPVGNQTLQVNANTLAITGGGTMSAAGTLALGGGVFGGAGLFDVFGNVTWSSGSIQGSGGTLRVEPGGTLAISGATARTFTNQVIEIGTAATWTGAAQVNTGLGAVLRVLSGGSLDVQGDPSVLNNQGGTTARLEVQGTLTRSTSTGAATFQVEVDNDAQVTASSGTLRLSNGSGAGTADGTYTVNAGATLDFAGGTHALGAAGAVGGAGTITVSNGIVNAGGNWNVTGSTTISFGTLNYNAASGSSTNLNITGGTLGGAAGGLLSVPGAMTWSSGSIAGAGGRARVLSGGTLAISGTTNRAFTNYILELAGSGTWTGTHQLNAGVGAILRVLAGGSLDVQGDPTYANNQGGTAPRLEVLGTLTRSTSTNVAVIQAEFDNDAQTTVSVGTLRLSGGSGAGTADGNYQVLGGATLDFNGGTHSLGAASNVNGAGTVLVSGGIVNDTGALAITGAGAATVNGGTFNYNRVAGGSTTNLNVASGTHGGSGLLTVSTAMNWTGGSMVGGGGTTRVLNGATLAMSPAATFTNYTLELGGTGTWSGAGQLNTGLGAVLRVLSTGNLNVTGTPNFTQNQGGTLTILDNLGTFQKTTAGTATMNVAVNSSNAINVTAGVLSLTNGGSQTGTAAVSTGAFLDYNGGTFNFTGPHAMTGAGTVRVPAGTLTTTSATDTAKFSNLQLNGGTLSQVGVVRANTLLDWAAGSVTGTGKVYVAPGASFTMTGTSTRTFTNGVIENDGAATWSGTFQLNTGLSAVLRNLPTRTFTLSGDGTFTLNQGGGATFDNQGTFTRNTSLNSVTWTAFFNHATGAAGSIQTGTFSVNGGATFDAPVTIAAGAFFDLNGSVMTFSTPGIFSGAGTARLQGGNLTTASAADSARFANLQINGGALIQPGVVRAVTLLDWTGGNITGTGKVYINPGASLTLTGTATRTFTNGIIENDGTATWSGTFQLNTGLGAVMRNLATRSFTLSGDPTFSQNQGGTQTVFDNRGTFTRNTSAGTSPWGVFFNDTTGTVAINTGVLQLAGGGRLGGTTKSVTSPGVLELTGGTLTFKAGASITGTGKLTGTAGTITPDSNSAAAAVALTNFDLGGANLTHEGLLTLGGTFNWNSGNITSNTAGLGGTTRVLAGGTINILTTANRTFAGVHLLEIASSASGTWAGTGSPFINTGNGAILRVQTGANFAVTNDNPTISLNQGGTATLDNLGTITRNGLANFVVNVPVSGGGAWTLNGGSFDMQGGGTVNGITTLATGTTIVFNNGTFTYGGNLTGTGTATFLMNAGTVNFNATLSVPTMTIAGGSFVMGTNPISVTGNFATSGGGTITMNNTLDSLDINGNASFGGGNSTLSAGGIRVAGNFTQTGGTNFAATGTHHVVLDGAAAQSISFANATNNFFRRLEINKAGGGVTLSTDTRVTGTFRIVTGTSVTGPTARLTVLDSIKSPTTLSSLTPLVVEVGNWLASDSGAFSPDTAVFLGGGTTPFVIPNGVFTTYVYKSIRVASDTVTVNGTISAANDVVVGGLPAVSGTLAIAGASTLNVGGSLRTEGAGRLKMMTSGSNVNVTGNASFAGASTSGLLTASAISIQGSFSQAGNAAAYAPTGTQVTRFALPGSAVIQQINFANPTTSFFDSLDLNRGTGTRGTVNFQTDARINRGLSIQNSTDVTGATARLSIVGGSLTASQSTTSPTMLTTRALELAVTPPALANMVGAVNISPDTVVINTGITTLPTASGLRYNSIRINTGATITFGADTINKDLHIASGTVSIPSATYRVLGKLRTTGSGVLAMPIGAGAPTLTVVDSAIFGGGNSTNLAAGFLRLQGNFVQTGGATFQAVTGHTTVIEGSTGQTVNFAAPGTGAAQSRFGDLQLARTVAGSSAATGIVLQSNAFAAGLVSDSATNGVVDSIAGGGFTMTATRFSTGTNFVFNNAQLSLTNFTQFSVSGLTFRNMNPANTYLTMTRNTTGADSPTGINFATAVTTGKYFNFSATAGYTWTVTGSTPAAASMTGNYVKTAAPNPTVSWNGTGLP